MIIPKFGTGLFGNPRQRFRIPPGCRMDLGCNYARYDILIKPRKGMKGVNMSRSSRRKSTGTSDGLSAWGKPCSVEGSASTVDEEGGCACLGGRSSLVTQFLITVC